MQQRTRYGILRRGSAARNYARSEDGSATVEFVLWVPVFVLILGLVVDVCFFFLAQSRLYDVTADATRRWALGDIATQADAEAFVENNAGFNGATPVATGTASGGQKTIVATIPASGVTLFGILGFVSGNNIEVRVSQINEGF